MPLFHYQAKNIEGKEKSGILEAKSKSELAKILHEQGFFLISASVEEEKRAEGFKIFKFLEKIRGVSLKEKLFFFRNLQVMISAGISLPRSIRTLAGQSQNKKFQKILYQIEEKLIKGYSLHKSFSLFPDVFSPLTVNMIKVGEESGTLETILENLTDHLEKRYQLRNRVIGALIYPAVIVIAMIAIGILMLVIVVPKLAAIFEELNIELPATTRAIIGLAEFILNYWYLVLGFFTVLGLVFRWFIKTEKGKDILDRFLLKTPILGNLLKKYYTVDIIRTLAILIRSGVPILNSLAITEGVASNKFFKKSLKEAKKEVKRGKSLALTLRKYSDLYSATVVEMLLVGEETGKTAEILEKLADFYDQEVNRIAQNLTSIIEPVLMLFIGAIVGFFAVSMIQPIYSLLGGIG